jgi:hypothetical protein
MLKVLMSGSPVALDGGTPLYRIRQFRRRHCRRQTPTGLQVRRNQAPHHARESLIVAVDRQKQAEIKTPGALPAFAHWMKAGLDFSV